VSIELEELKQAAAKLSEAERAELAYVLIQSLDSDTEDDEAERAWLPEVERPAGEVDRGEVKPIPGDEAFARLHRKYG
jgi:putative addiction module component (TIGR02574 family)